MVIYICENFSLFFPSPLSNTVIVKSRHRKRYIRLVQRWCRLLLVVLRYRSAKHLFKNTFFRRSPVDFACVVFEFKTPTMNIKWMWSMWGFYIFYLFMCHLICLLKMIFFLLSKMHTNQLLSFIFSIKIWGLNFLEKITIPLISFFY